MYLIKEIIGSFFSNITVRTDTDLIYIDSMFTFLLQCLQSTSIYIA